MFFICGQLFINYKHGVVFSPFFHYGMYSEVIPTKDHYDVTEVYINNERLASKNFSPQQWDNIIQPAEKFFAQKEWNSNLWHADIQRLLPFTDSSKFVNVITDRQFENWYKQRLEYITGKQVSTFGIKFISYTFNSASLTKSTP